MNASRFSQLAALMPLAAAVIAPSAWAEEPVRVLRLATVVDEDAAYFAVSLSRAYSGSVTLNSIAASCSGDLPMLSRNGSQRGSSWMFVNRGSTAIT